MISNLQLMLRKAMLHKATSETKSKFTGKGSGANLILKEDAECIIATVMEIIAAKRNNAKIVLSDGTEFDASAYSTIGTGLAKAMNWNGYTYFSDLDKERVERSFTSWTTHKYANDEYEVPAKHDGDKPVMIKAEGQVVSPSKFDDLVKDFNKLQGTERSIETGTNVNISSAKLSDFGYLYVNGELRQVSKEDSEYGASFATLFKPQFSPSFVFGRSADEETETIVLEWLW